MKSGRTRRDDGGRPGTRALAALPLKSVNLESVTGRAECRRNQPVVQTWSSLVGVEMAGAIAETRSFYPRAHEMGGCPFYLQVIDC